MKRLLMLGLMAASVFMASSAVAALINGVEIESVSSEFLAYGWGIGANHVIDGSGLANGKHAQMNYPGGNSWQTITQTGTGNIVFDLGSIYQLDLLHVWNLNFYAPYNGRGANQVGILLSSDKSAWEDLGYFQFFMASGLADDLGFTINASSWTAARYVQFDIKSNFGSSDNAGHVGLSEVQFYGQDGQTVVPEPGTALLLGVGLLGLAGLRRRMRV